MPDLNERYKAAHEAHAHYDKLSLAVVSAMILTVGGAYTIAEKVKTDVIIYASVIPILLLLLFFYYHLATFAGVARRVASKIERDGKYSKGVSEVYIDPLLLKKYSRKKDKLFYSVSIMNILLCIFMGISACNAYFELPLNNKNINSSSGKILQDN